MATLMIAFLRRTVVVLVSLGAGILGVAAAAATDHPPVLAHYAAADPGDDTCSCGQPAVDLGICADCIEVPNPVHEACGYRHMQPYPGGVCPRP